MSFQSASFSYSQNLRTITWSELPAVCTFEYRISLAISAKYIVLYGITWTCFVFFMINWTYIQNRWFRNTEFQMWTRYPELTPASHNRRMNTCTGRVTRRQCDSYYIVVLGPFFSLTKLEHFEVNNLVWDSNTSLDNGINCYFAFILESKKFHGILICITIFCQTAAVVPFIY